MVGSPQAVFDGHVTRGQINQDSVFLFHTICWSVLFARKNFNSGMMTERKQIWSPEEAGEGGEGGGGTQ